MQKRILWFLVVAMVGMSGTAFAWDGQRKGFILGGGAGLGLMSYEQSVDGVKIGDTESTVPLATDFRIGYAPNNLLQIFYVNKVSWFGMENILGDEVTVASSVGGIGVVRYMEEAAPSYFFMASIGASSWDTPYEEDSEAWTGFGFSLGWGYEFSPHFSFENSISIGEPSIDESGYTYKTSAVSIHANINVLGY